MRLPWYVLAVLSNSWLPFSMRSQWLLRTPSWLLFSMSYTEIISFFLRSKRQVQNVQRCLFKTRLFSFLFICFLPHFSFSSHFSLLPSLINIPVRSMTKVCDTCSRAQPNNHSSTSLICLWVWMNIGWQQACWTQSSCWRISDNCLDYSYHIDLKWVRSIWQTSSSIRDWRRLVLAAVTHAK